MKIRSHALRLARSAVLATCRATRVSSVVRDSRWRQQRLLILGYHGVAIEDEHEWNPELFVSPAVLESRLDLLRRGGYAVLPLAEALDLLSRGRLPRRSVALTFDDGMYDFYCRAFPALKDRGFPATVYLTTYYCGFERPIFNLVVSYLLWKSPLHRWRPRRLFGVRRAFDLPAERATALAAVIEHAETHRLSASDKDRLAEDVAASLEVDYAVLASKRLLHLMNAREVAELAGEGVDFQMHTHRHRAPRNEALFERELADNSVRIAELTGLRPQHFCYPGGEHDDRLRAWLMRFGVRSATTCDPGLASGSTPYLALPRFIDTSFVSPLIFEGWLTGIGAWLALRQYRAPLA